MVAGLVVILAASLWGGDRIKEWRERTRSLPPPGSSNVLLIVLDAVAASHMSLHGYERPTSPTMVDLAERGIRFDSAQASSSWTLPSHASMLTGRWPHELSAGWQTPLDESYPTVAEFLARRAMPRRPLSRTISIVQAIQGWDAGLPNTTIMSFPN